MKSNEFDCSKAAYGAYHNDLPPMAFEDLPMKEQRRWLKVVQAVERQMRVIVGINS